jgi:hypothetical protein
MICKRLLLGVALVATLSSARRAAAQPAASPPPPVPAPSAAAPATAAPRRLEVGKEGFFQPGFLLQGWFTIASAEETTSTFRVRRAELYFRGEIVPDRFAYLVMVDPSKVLEFSDTTVPVEPADAADDEGETVTVKQPASAVSILQDAFITYKSAPVDVSVGQFKIPLSLEGYGSSSKLLFPERATVARTYGDRRDIGVRVAKTFPVLSYTLGLFNGAGPNNLDVDTAKDLAFRVEGYPTQWAMIGSAGYVTLADRDEPRSKERVEADLRIEVGPVSLQAEAIRGRDVGNDGVGVPSAGFAAALACRLGDAQAAARVGHMDPDLDRDLDPATAAGRDELWHFDGALSYLLGNGPEAKLQVGYSRFQYQDAPVIDQVTLVAQASY